jgi:hypothetical protein
MVSLLCGVLWLVHGTRYRAPCVSPRHLAATTARPVAHPPRAAGGCRGLSNRSSKVLRGIDLRGAPGPVAAARASHAAELACGALRGAVGGSPRAAPHGYRKKRRKAREGADRRALQGTVRTLATRARRQLAARSRPETVGGTPLITMCAAAPNSAGTALSGPGLPLAALREGRTQPPGRGPLRARTREGPEFCRYHPEFRRYSPERPRLALSGP